MDDKEKLEQEKLQKELELRENIISILQAKKATSTDSVRGRLDRLVEMIENGEAGWQEQSIVKGILKEYRQNERRIVKEQQLAEAKNTVEGIIDAYNFYVKASGSALWYYQSLDEDVYGNRHWYSVRADTLKVAFPRLDVIIRAGEGVEDYNSFKEFNRKLHEMGRTFTHITQSYRDEPGALNIMHRNRLEPHPEGLTDYHWIFDAIMESISGGLKGSETFNAFQKIFWAKYSRPNNVYIPNISVRDVNGRAGKSLFSNTFGRTLFQGNIADNCNIDHILGKFNSVIAGKNLIIINETNRKRVDADRTKAVLGSPSIPIEPKGQDIYWADNLGLYMFYTNDPNGGVHVSGTSSDNRISFFSSRETIYSACARWFKSQGLDLTELEIKQWIESSEEASGQNLLSSKEEVQKWISAMQETWGDLQHVEPHHAEEHARLIESQRANWTELVDQVFAAKNFEYIRAQLLTDMIKHFYRGEYVPGRNILRQEIERLIQDRGYDIELVQRSLIVVDGGTIQRPVYRRVGTGTCSGDESQYGETDDQGRWKWNWLA